MKNTASRQLSKLIFLSRRWPLYSYINYLETLLANIELYEGISTSNTQLAWGSLWGNRIKHVLMVAVKDYSGSLYKWTQAINNHTDWAARMITFSRHQYGYNTDIVLPPGSLPVLGGQIGSIYDRITKLIAESRIIHFKDEQVLFNGLMKSETNYELLNFIFKKAKELNKKTVFTTYGGYQRKYKDDKNYRQFTKSFDLRIAMTPDLNYQWFNGVYIPHSIEISEFPYLWNDGHLVAHSPTTTARKGTEAFLHACEKIPNIKVDIINNVSYTECLERKKKATLFFDQAGREQQATMGCNDEIGWYGNSAIEAMAFGIPTIAYLSLSAFEGARRGGQDISKRCPVINTKCEDEEAIHSTIQAYFRKTSEERHELSLQSRAWIESFHGNSIIAKTLVKEYESLST